MSNTNYSNSIINFFKDNFYLIDSNQYYDVLSEAYYQFGESDYSNFLKIIELLKEACPTTLTKLNKDLLQVWEDVFLNRLEAERNDPYNPDPANGWSRLDWMFEAIGTFNLDKNLLINHLLNNQAQLNLDMKPLEAEYSYFGSDTWDLGWFNKERYNPEGY